MDFLKQFQNEIRVLGENPNERSYYTPFQNFLKQELNRIFPKNDFVISAMGIMTVGRKGNPVKMEEIFYTLK